MRRRWRWSREFSFFHSTPASSLNPSPVMSRSPSNSARPCSDGICRILREEAWDSLEAKILQSSRRRRWPASLSSNYDAGQVGHLIDHFNWPDPTRRSIKQIKDKRKQTDTMQNVWYFGNLGLMSPPLSTPLHSSPVQSSPVRSHYPRPVPSDRPTLCLFELSFRFFPT